VQPQFLQMPKAGHLPVIQVPVHPPTLLVQKMGSRLYSEQIMWSACALQATGFVGIGTTAPKALLNLPSKGSVTLSTTDNFLLGSLTSNNLALDYNKIQSRNNGAANTLQLNPKGGAVALGHISGTTNPGLYVGADGAVGVGGQYTQPNYALTVNPSSAGNGLFLYNPGDGYLLHGQNTGGSDALVIENISASNVFSAIAGSTAGPGVGVLGVNGNGAGGSAGVRGHNEGSGYGLWGSSNNGVDLFAESVNNFGIYARPQMLLMPDISIAAYL